MSEFEEILIKPCFNFIRILFSVKILPYASWVIIFCFFLAPSMALIFMLFITILSIFFTPLRGIKTGNFMPLLITLSAIIIFSIAIVIIVKYIIKRNYEATTYKILKDKIEFNEGFINHKFTSIEIKNIKEVHLTQSFVQRFFKLGTIRIMTAGSNSGNGGGLVLEDIENSASVYSYINKRVNDILGVPQDNDKVITLKPDCTSSYYIFPAMLCGILYAISIVPIITIFIIAMMNPNAKMSDSLNVFIIIGTLLPVIIAILFTIISNKLYKLEYKNRKYLISPTKIETKARFINHHYTIILMKNIKEIRLERGFIQRKFGLGSIQVSTSANNISMQTTKRSNQTSFYLPGITIGNLKEYLQTYKQLKSMHDYSVSENARNIANDRPQYTYRPTFKFLESFICLSPTILLILGFSIPAFIGWNFISGLSIFVVTSLLFMALPIFLTKKNYECSKYEIYPTRIEFHEGYIINKSSSIMIENIREVHMEEDFVQRMFKLGSIKILTSGTTDAMSTNDSGTIFRDIMNCKEVYMTLKQFIKDKKEHKYTEINTDIKQNLPEEKEIIDETVNTQNENKEIITPTMTIKPNFIFLNKFLDSFILITGVLIILPIFFGLMIISIMITSPKANMQDGFMLLRVSFLIAPLIIILFGAFNSCINCIFDKFNYKATKYEFFKDKIDFTEGFFNNKYTSIEYKNIREITLFQNWLQKIFKLGTIKIETSAGTSFSGLRLRDIDNPNKIYKMLENEIKSHSKNPNIESNLIMEFKPKYNLSYICLRHCTVAAFLAYFLLFFNIIVAVPAFIITAVVMKIKFKYQKFKIFSDKIETSFSFINDYSTIIFNEKIREVHLSKDFIQRAFYIGTFTIVTSASGGRGCNLFDVADTEKINNILKEIENNNKNK